MKTSEPHQHSGGGGRLLSFIWRKPADSVAERTRRRVTLHLIPYLFFLYILAYLDRVNVSVAQLGMVEPPLQASVASAAALLASPQGFGWLLGIPGFLAGRSAVLNVGGLGFDPKIIGFGAGIFFWGYWILEIPSTVSVVHWGARWVFVRILILWGLCATVVGAIGTPFGASLFAWLPHLPEDAPLQVVSGTARFVNGLRDHPTSQFYFFRFMLGLFEGGFFPSVIVYLSHWFRTEDRAKAIAAFMSAIPLSNILGSPLSGFILRHVDWLGLPGWRWIFILEGIPPILAGFATLFFLPDRPAKAKWLPAEERDWLVGELDREHKAKQGQGHWAWVHHLGMVLLLTMVYFLLNVSSYGLSMFMPAIIKSQSGVSNEVASYLAALPYVMAFLAMWINGWHSDRTGERIWHVAVPLMLSSLGIWLASALDGIGWLSVLVMIFGVGTFMYAHLPAFWPIPTMFLGATVAASAIGFINMMGNLGGYFGPNFVGGSATGQVSFAPALRFLALAPLVSAAIIVILAYVRRKARPGAVASLKSSS
jgi:ACS family tartrate transporter-like MFS transporter